jgi:enamine deaminase RidA (YjgF/YER057c/UK114 family)
MPQSRNSAVQGIEPILPRPEVALKNMRYAPGIRVTPDMDLVYFSGLTAYPLEVDPWNPGSFQLPQDIDAQNRMLTENIDKLLQAAGITWQHIILMVRHTVENASRDFTAEKFGDWRPCTTSLWVSETGVPGAKVLYEVTAVAPRRR